MPSHSPVLPVGELPVLQLEVNLLMITLSPQTGNMSFELVLFSISWLAPQKLIGDVWT